MTTMAELYFEGFKTVGELRALLAEFSDDKPIGIRYERI